MVIIAVFVHNLRHYFVFYREGIITELNKNNIVFINTLQYLATYFKSIVFKNFIVADTEYDGRIFFPKSFRIDSSNVYKVVVYRYYRFYFNCNSKYFIRRDRKTRRRASKIQRAWRDER